MSRTSRRSGRLSTSTHEPVCQASRCLPVGMRSPGPGGVRRTPQSCSYRDDYEEFLRLDALVFGLSTQATGAQREFAEREHIPFPLLSDHDHEFGSALELPTFYVQGDDLYKRVTLIARGGAIQHVRYPVFPPNEDAVETLRWLRSHS